MPMITESYKRRLQVWETGGAWIVERIGKPVALLTDSQMVEQFWRSWKLQPLSDDPTERAAIFKAEYWDPELDSEKVYRSREFGSECSTAFPALDPFWRDPDRLVMRGLYHPCKDPWPWDDFVMWLRRIAGKQTDQH